MITTAGAEGLVLLKDTLWLTRAARGEGQEQSIVWADVRTWLLGRVGEGVEEVGVDDKAPSRDAAREATGEGLGGHGRLSAELVNPFVPSALGHTGVEGHNDTPGLHHGDHGDDGHGRFLKGEGHDVLDLKIMLGHEPVGQASAELVEVCIVHIAIPRTEGRARGGLDGLLLQNVVKAEI